MTPEAWREGIQSVAAGSATMVSWALAVAGGSIVTIVSTSYLRPPLRMRSVYLLFLPGWLLLGMSTYFGDAISRGYLAAQFVPVDLLPTIARSINHEYVRQQDFLSYGLIVFGLWLVVFLLWWVFDEAQPTPGAPTHAHALSDPTPCRTDTAVADPTGTG
jgi:hypothetical protein